ncbi:MAG: nitrogenase iron-molybdenum cofactor biosynthesis protein NifE, partial [Candidatus Pacearchaeota archaeon]|nr:nitrogenase iron-molybdenum cofactor biosynthesis protein NifE [Candidatus Pacearchaeota archaeon]
MVEILKEREKQVYKKGESNFVISCDKQSTSGSVSQRACVFCGSRVVLYPVADAVHLVHGPVGCAAYTWDIRGALSSGPELHRNSFSTDLREGEVIFGGEKKLEKSMIYLIDRYRPKALFVYSTCIIGIIGDDVEAVCGKVAKKTDIPVIPVHSEGFKGTKKDGYKAACTALLRLIGTGNRPKKSGPVINILGEFNLAGESWIIKNYYKKMGISIQSVMTGDSRIEEIKNAHRADLNVVQCSGSMLSLAKMMKEKWSIPYIHVSYFGIEDTAAALYAVADHFNEPEIINRTKELVVAEVNTLAVTLASYKEKLKGKKAAIYVGGAFKAFSLIKALRRIGMDVVIAGSQTGSREDYEQLKSMCKPGTIILDDSNPLELSRFVQETGAELFIGGVKERPIAMKFGLGFCDHNHERKIPLAGFEGMKNFAAEVYSSVMSPVWRFHPLR